MLNQRMLENNEITIQMPINIIANETVSNCSLTAKSLNGCISIPSGNLDLWSNDSVFGIEFNVHLKMLQVKKKTTVYHTDLMNYSR